MFSDLLLVSLSFFLLCFASWREQKGAHPRKTNTSGWVVKEKEVSIFSSIFLKNAICLI